MPDGLVVLDKPGGMTSHDVVARVRRLAGTRKVGHAGTLDPMATGVLLLGVGRATRLLGHLTLAEKTYEATVRLGQTTTTDDAEGEPLATTPLAPDAEQVARAGLASQVGEIDQVPSSVSAVKVDGRRAHARVRAGEDVVLPARRVTIHELEVTRVELPDVDIAVRCSSGTYVRAIARDVGGHLTALRRTSVGPFTLADARSLDDELHVVPIAEVARRCFPAVDLDDDRAADVRVGRKLALDLGATGAVALFAPDGTFLALYEQDGELARAVAVFTG